jgi:hypothetical protein
VERAARIAIAEIGANVEHSPEIDRVVIAVRGDEAMRIHRDALARHPSGN